MGVFDFQVRHNVMSVPSLGMFADIKGRFLNSSRDVYFVREIGMSSALLQEVEKTDRVLTERMNAGRGRYNRCKKLPVLALAEDVSFYSQCYDT